MGKKILLGIGIIIILALVYSAYFFFYATRQASPLESINFNKENYSLTLAYSRPYKNGRVIFAEGEEALQPYGVYWRLGANRATRLTINNPVDIMGNRLDSGDYAVYAIPGSTSWIIAFNKDFDRWGAAPADESKDIFRIQVPVDYSNPVIEQLTISFQDSEIGADMVVEWDNAKIKIPIALK